MSHARDIAKFIVFTTDEGTVSTEFVDSDTITSSTTGNISSPTGKGTIGYATPNDLPAGAPAGTQAFVDSNDTLYLSNGSGWYKIALVNRAPRWVTEPAETYTLSTTGVSTTVEILGGDSDAHDIPLSYTATGDSNFNAIATVTKDSDNGRIFYITPIDSEGSGATTNASGILTFTISDGKNSVLDNSTFSISLSTLIEYLVVGGGGGGGGGQSSSGNVGGGGGGGAGGVVYNASYAVISGLNYTVTIGGGGGKGFYQDGGGGRGIGYAGGNSVFGSSIGYGGGGGGYPGGTTPQPGRTKDGGSAGGSSGYPASGSGASTQPDSDGYGGTGYGYIGQTWSSAYNATAGGGGGGGAGGQPAQATGSGGGQGGPGFNSNITGSTVMYGYGGGAGSGSGNSSGAYGNGSAGKVNAPANSGAGGSGQGKGNTNGGYSGGSGIVIIVTPTGSEPTISGGLVYSTDTSSRTGKSIISFTSGTGTVSW